MLKELDDYDWDSVFGECESTVHNCPPIIPSPQPPGSDVSTTTFCREDVVKIYYQVNGVADEEDWVVCGKLKDDRYFVARGGCDYTGWDCQASNSGDVAKTKKDILRYGLGEEERKRVGVKLNEK